ncbi:MAG: pentapeptide repeat-containing protein [Ignavibacteriaceae bacterium]
MRRDFIVRDKPIPPVFPKNIIHCYDGMELINTISSIKEEDALNNNYYIHVYPNTIIGNLQSILIPQGIILVFPVVPVDLPKIRMTNAYFCKRYLAGIMFGNFGEPITAELIGARFESSNLNRCIFSFANLTNSDFSFSNAHDASFDWTDLTNSSFYAANLTGVNFSGANLTAVNFYGTNLTNATLPDNANTKTLFKALVSLFDPATTIWTDGLPIG